MIRSSLAYVVLHNGLPVIIFLHETGKLFVFHESSRADHLKCKLNYRGKYLHFGTLLKFHLLDNCQGSDMYSGCI